MTVFKDSIHIGSTSPSHTIHLGLSPGLLASSRIRVENRPAGMYNYNTQSNILWH